ncbi:MAG: PilN domain-containing protein, partial [Desulfobacteraceae bacterium]|nr:PilN domain-containing protein [Desulfobacteraceae bacterium]
QEIKKQEATIKKIDAFKKEKKTLTTKMGIINQLQKSKSGPVHVLDDLSISLPGRLWLTSIKQKGMNLEISGKSLDNISISKYMTNLEKSRYFKNVDLKQIKTETKRGPKGIQLKKFLITCKIIYSVKNIDKKTPTKKKG